ncbi:hypothetical protein F5Y00DRAFT_253779 [Daldinia vernicosa]|uniref:uncharacterized protein n=1 Tax=Daldinia vernicosa TaxID=114800 RepID=UPI0020075AD1|nr:uncharacterized protein F5Y00DRAFT_253779 [Daldinia vernicosa]KAI0847797.1 hypothetical protein F5Y00DRAFT_253779 [Daldinia vernicosa]
MSNCSWSDPLASANVSTAYEPALLAQGIIPKGTVSSRILSTSNLAKNVQRPAKSGQHYRPNYSSDFALDSPRYDITGPNTRLYHPLAFDDLISSSNFHPPPSAIQPLETTPQYMSSASRASSASTISQTSYLATEAKQRQSARELFEQHGIRRPTGWFSDDEDLSLLGDRTAGPRRFCRICHVCSTPTRSQTHCLSCQHRLCEKCLCEVPKSTEKEHKTFSHNHNHTTRQDKAQYTKPALSNPEPVRLAQEVSRSHNRTRNNRSAQGTALHQPSYAHYQGNSAAKIQPVTSKNIVSEKPAQPAALYTASLVSERPNSPQGLPVRSVKQNPFVVGDKERVESTTESHVREPLAARHYHCYRPQPQIGGRDHEVSNSHVECDNPMCRATHAGHYPYRHSITCALHRSEEFEKHGGSRRELPVSDNPSVAHPLGPQSRKDTLRPPYNTIHRHHFAGLETPYHIIAEHITSGANHGIRHLDNNHAGKTVDGGITGQRQEFKSTETECASHAGRGYEDNHDIAGTHAITRGEAASRAHTANTAKEIGRGTRGRKSLPKSRVFSPPSWLQAPSKEAGDARSRLHHIDVGNHQGRSLHVDVMNLGGGGVNYSRKTSQAEDRQASSHDRRRPTHLQVEDIRYSRNTYRSTPLARSDISNSQHSLEGSERPRSFVHEQSRIKSNDPENGRVHPRDDTRTVRENRHSPLSTTTRASHSPLQPRQILRDVDERGMFESRSAMLEPEDRKSSVTITGATSEFEVHRPSPISPSNHDCSWKDLYLALTAEIRLLKAELSTRASLGGADVDYTRRAGEDIANEEDDLGIEGVTIVVHLKGKDDLVINTDLTQAVE